MRCIIALLGSALLLGCAAQNEARTVDSLPQPLGTPLLPPFPSSFTQESRLFFKVYVDHEGSVRRVDLQTPSGDEYWDSLAIESVKSWQFSPARVDGRPVATWVRIPVVLRFTTSRSIILAEIVLASSDAADSVYAMLMNGEDFGRIAREWSRSPSALRSGSLGTVGLASFSPKVQMTLLALADEAFTKPMLVNDRYVIFKRIRIVQ